MYSTFENFPPEVLGIFGYGGKNGPDHWGELSSKYSSCSNGKWQSPVDIVKDKVVRNKNMKPLIRDYGPANATLVNNGFNIAVWSQTSKSMIFSASSLIRLILIIVA